MLHYLVSTGILESINCHITAIEWEYGPSVEILMDNDPTFCGQGFWAFVDKWRVGIGYWCACIWKGNSIAEWCHCTIKRIAARTQYSIQEAEYYYNVTSKDNTTLPTALANRIYQYEQCVKEIDASLLPSNSVKNQYQAETIPGSKFCIADVPAVW